MARKVNPNQIGKHRVIIGKAAYVQVYQLKEGSKNSNRCKSYIWRTIRTVDIPKDIPYTIETTVHESSRMARGPVFQTDDLFVTAIHTNRVRVYDETKINLFKKQLLADYLP